MKFHINDLIIGQLINEQGVKKKSSKKYGGITTNSRFEVYELLWINNYNYKN